MKRSAIAVLVLMATVQLFPSQPARWVKGNTHAHTNCSDGGEYPHRVARWYQDHGYQFLFITDHNMITATLPLDADGNRDDFIVLPGDEISFSLLRRQAHVCALNPSQLPQCQAAPGMQETLQNSIDAARKAGAVPVINHPLRRWSIGVDDMKALRGVYLFELLNMPRESNNSPAGGSTGSEGLWDALLTSGMVLFGIAADDSHDFLGDFLPGLAHPGKGWVVVRVNELTAGEICAALEKGDFYASTGVELTDVQVTAAEYRIVVKPYLDALYTTWFIGRDGKVLKEEHGLNPVYAFTGDELYVRAKVVSSMGETAFCQPVFFKK